MLNPLANNRSLAVVLSLGLLVLLVVAIGDLGWSLPKPPTRQGPLSPIEEIVPVSKIAAVFSSNAFAQVYPPTNLPSLFYTTRFIPPAVPPPPPSPKATTRKIEVTYQGFYQVADGPKQAFIKTGDTLFVGPAGARVATAWAVQDFSLRALTLTNNVARTNILEINQKKEFEIPLP